MRQIGGLEVTETGPVQCTKRVSIQRYISIEKNEWNLPDNSLFRTTHTRNYSGNLVNHGFREWQQRNICTILERKPPLFWIIYENCQNFLCCWPTFATLHNFQLPKRVSSGRCKLLFQQSRRCFAQLQIKTAA